jgi:hypothetical protein
MQGELELVWLMHGAIFYQGIREHVYGLPGLIDHDRMVETAIKMYLSVAAGNAQDRNAPASSGQPDRTGP